MEKIAQMRFRSQQLATPAFKCPRDLVAWMGAVQAQDYDMSKWAVGMRIEGGTLRMVNEALEKGEIVRTHIMRPTWHWVAGEDIRWMLKLSGARIKKCVDLWTKASGIDIPEDVYTRCNDLLGKILSGNKSLTKEEMTIEFNRAGILTEDERVRRYMLRAEVEGIICSGADRDGKPTYALIEERVAPVRELSKDEALAKLALNYFRSHSPATLKDFVWWSGLTVTEAKSAIGAIGNQLITMQFELQEFFIHESCREAIGDHIHFLPSYDEYLISYKDRSAVLDPQHYPKAFNRWGIFYPVLLYKGRIIGNWSRETKKGKINIDVSFFEPADKVENGPLKAAENRYRKFREEK